MKSVIVFITYFIGGIVDAVCGGGGLITLPVLFAIGVPAHIAVGTNQTSILPGVVTSVVKFHKSGRIDIKTPYMQFPSDLSAVLREQSSICWFPNGTCRLFSLF